MAAIWKGNFNLKVVIGTVVCDYCIYSYLGIKVGFWCSLQWIIAIALYLWFLFCSVNETVGILKWIFINDGGGRVGYNGHT